MKKLIIYLFIILFAVNAWADDEFSFRGTTWGMSKAEVKKIEKGTLTSETHRGLAYDVGTVLGMETECFYFFNDNNELGMALYSLKSESMLAYSKHIENYNKVKNTIIEKYGPPTRDEVIWRDKAFKNIVDDLGMALRAGYIDLKTGWLDYKNAEILMETEKESVNIIINLVYIDKQRGEELLQSINNDKKTENDQLF